jgi:hypothetical protein
MGEFDAEEKDSRTPNEGLHSVVEAESGRTREGRGNEPESMSALAFVGGPQNG